MIGRLSLQRRIALSVGAAILVSAGLMLALLQGLARRFETNALDQISGLGLRHVARELARVPAGERPARLRVLARDFTVPLRVVPLGELAPPEHLARLLASADADGFIVLPPHPQWFPGPPPGGAARPLFTREFSVGMPPPGFAPPGLAPPPHCEPHEPPGPGPHPFEAGPALRPFEPGPPHPFDEGPPRGGALWPFGPHGRGHRVGGPRLAYPLPEGEALVVGPLPPPVPAGLWPLGVVAFGFLFVSVLLASVLVAAPLTRRIRAIERAVDALSRGDFDTRVEGPRDDALGVVAVALDRSAERLRRLFSEREELLQAVSHEIGTPLSRMRFQLEILERTTDENRRRAQIQAIDGEIRELDELSSELVRWVEVDSRELRVEPVAAGPVLEEVVDLERAASDRDPAVPVELDLDEQGAAASLEVEPRQFARAVENILRNALRYAKSSVRLEGRVRAGRRFEITVFDDGPGIPEADRSRVLQPFVRLERSRSREHGGTGLGLAIARRIVERHGGSIRIGEAPEGGAAITLAWPLPGEGAVR